MIKQIPQDSYLAEDAIKSPYPFQWLSADDLCVLLQRGWDFEIIHSVNTPEGPRTLVKIAPKESLTAA